MPPCAASMAPRTIAANGTGYYYACREACCAPDRPAVRTNTLAKPAKDLRVIHPIRTSTVRRRKNTCEMGSSMNSRSNLSRRAGLGRRAEGQTLTFPMRPPRGWIKETMVALEEASTLATLLQGRPHADAILTHPQRAARTNALSIFRPENPCL